ncbi:hypothetical protein V8E36_009449 [Tilletia maclaganii]
MPENLQDHSAGAHPFQAERCQDPLAGCYSELGFFLDGLFADPIPSDSQQVFAYLSPQLRSILEDAYGVVKNSVDGGARLQGLATQQQQQIILQRLGTYFQEAANSAHARVMASLIGGDGMAPSGAPLPVSATNLPYDAGSSGAAPLNSATTFTTSSGVTLPGSAAQSSSTSNTALALGFGSSASATTPTTLATSGHLLPDPGAATNSAVPPTLANTTAPSAPAPLAPSPLALSLTANSASVAGEGNGATAASGPSKKRFTRGRLSGPRAAERMVPSVQSPPSSGAQALQWHYHGVFRWEKGIVDGKALTMAEIEMVEKRAKEEDISGVVAHSSRTRGITTPLERKRTSRAALLGTLRERWECRQCGTLIHEQARLALLEHRHDTATKALSDKAASMEGQVRELKLRLEVHARLLNELDEGQRNAAVQQSPTAAVSPVSPASHLFGSAEPVTPIKAWRRASSDDRGDRSSNATVTSNEMATELFVMASMQAQAPVSQPGCSLPTVALRAPASTEGALLPLSPAAHTVGGRSNHLDPGTALAEALTYPIASRSRLPP